MVTHAINTQLVKYCLITQLLKEHEVHGINAIVQDMVAKGIRDLSAGKVPEQLRKRKGEPLDEWRVRENQFGAKFDWCRTEVSTNPILAGILKKIDETSTPDKFLTAGKEFDFEAEANIDNKFMRVEVVQNNAEFCVLIQWQLHQQTGGHRHHHNGTIRIPKKPRLVLIFWKPLRDINRPEEEKEDADGFRRPKKTCRASRL
jgi:hypothetical protein